MDARLSEIRKTISRLKDEPISFKDYSDYVMEWIVREGGSVFDGYFAKNAVGWRNINRDGVRDVVTLPWSFFEPEDGRNGSPLLGEARAILHQIPSIQALCAFLPDKVHAAMMKAIRETVGDSWPDGRLPVAERRAMIAALTEEERSIEEQRAKLQAELDAIIASVAV